MHFKLLLITELSTLDIIFGNNCTKSDCEGLYFSPRACLHKQLTQHIILKCDCNNSAILPGSGQRQDCSCTANACSSTHRGTNVPVFASLILYQEAAKLNKDVENLKCKTNLQLLWEKLLTVVNISSHVALKDSVVFERPPFATRQS